MCKFKQKNLIQQINPKKSGVISLAMSRAEITGEQWKSFLKREKPMFAF